MNQTTKLIAPGYVGKTATMSLIWVLFSIFLTSFGYTQESKTQDQSLPSMDCTIVDEEGSPIFGAMVFDCPNFYLLKDPSAPNAASLTTTNSLGHFRLERKPANQSWGVFVFAEGKVVDMLRNGVGHRSKQVRLKDESRIEVIVYDERGKPIQGAKVAPSVLDFRASSWSYFLSPAVIEQLQSTTDATGRTLLRGADANALNAIQVDIGNGSKRTFELPAKMDRNSPIVLNWKSFHGSLRCRVLDHQNRPVRNAPVTLSSLDENANSLVITEPTISFIQCAHTDDRGECNFREVPAPEVDVRCNYGDQDHRGVLVESKSIPIRHNEITKVELKFLPTKTVEFSVLDTSELKQHAGVSVVFRKDQVSRNVFATGTTNEEGLGSVTLEVGTWDVEIQQLSSLPKGYFLSDPTETKQIVVTEDAEAKPVPPILIAKGRTIEGKISGVDFAELRSSELVANVIEPSGTERQFCGAFQLNGDFQITLPSDTSDEQIVGFRIPRAAQKLTISLKSPWMLKGNAE